MSEKTFAKSHHPQPKPNRRQPHPHRRHEDPCRQDYARRQEDNTQDRWLNDRQTPRREQGHQGRKTTLAYVPLRVVPGDARIDLLSFCNSISQADEARQERRSLGLASLWESGAVSCGARTARSGIDPGARPTASPRPFHPRVQCLSRLEPAANGLLRPVLYRACFIQG